MLLHVFGKLLLSSRWSGASSRWLAWRLERDDVPAQASYPLEEPYLQKSQPSLETVWSYAGLFKMSAASDNAALREATCSSKHQTSREHKSWRGLRLPGQPAQHHHLQKSAELRRLSDKPSVSLCKLKNYQVMQIGFRVEGLRLR